MNLSRRIACVLVFSAVMALCTGLFEMTACSPAANKQVVKSAIDIAVAVCIAEHSDEDAETVKAVCGIAEELGPVVRDLIGAHRRAAVKMGARLDAGKD